ncbi:PAS domain S-box protein [Microseira wollei]|uniref:histidine kinase n=1 Tax=Microseira wollei NIES-4236 TaxID=2530354 RepID=A0AAV3XJ32_9CYAN|nr:PAS domain S-box protein [Microseira wollei]GET41025.1 multi-sensor hybrid histidine kinase [Microseira wollei NIES-4236]
MPNFATSKQISAATSAFAIFIACLVLVGWGLDIAILKSVFPGAATMKANTAVCFILAGVSLWLTGRGGGDAGMGRRGESPQIVPRPQKKTLRRYWVLVAQICAIASATLAILTLSQYLFGWNLGIDELLFRDSPLSPATLQPGRMGLNTAINFSLVGGALWLLHKGESESGQKDNLILLAQGLSLVAILIALQAIVGYAYKVEVFYQLSAYSTSMALHTAVTFLVLGVGVLFARPQRGLMKTIVSDLNGGIVARRMIPSAIALPLILGWIILQGQQANYYDPAFGISLLAVLMCAIYIALIWRNAAFLNQLDGKRFRAEAAVRESEARYSILAENVPEILFTNLPDGWNDYTSPRFYEYTGMPPGSAEGFGWMGALHPDDAEPSRLQWMESIKTGQVLEIEYRFRRADGVYRWFKGRSIPLRDRDGKIKKWFGVCTDIDDQKRTQEQLRQSQERLQRMVETAQIGIAFASSTGEMFEANNAFLEMLGYTREEMFSPGLNWRTLTPPEYSEINFQAIAELAQTGEFNSVEKELFRKDGSRVPVLVSGTRIDGEPDEHVAFIVDLSERKSASAALQESEAKFRRIFESNIVGIYFGNFSGKISEANDAFLEMFGYTRADLQAGILRWDSMTPPEYQALDREKIKELQTAGLCTPFEKEYISKDGRRIPIILAIALMPGREKDGLSVCFVLDISQQKQIQAELQESETRLKIALEATNTVCWERDLTCSRLIFTTKANDPAKLQVISYSEALSWIHPDEREKVHQANESAIANKGAFEVEHRIRETPERDWRWVLAKGKVIADETGKPTRIIGVSVDITERKEAEFSIKRSEERLQLFVESDLIGISAGDEHGNLTEANDAYLKIIGYTREDFCAGKVRWFELTPPEYLPLDFAAIAEARAKGTSSYYEKEYIRKNGTRVPVLMGCAAFGESGEELMAFTLDISDRKQIESQLRQLNETLEERVKQRTAQLEATNKELESFCLSKRV